MNSEPEFIANRPLALQFACGLFLTMHIRS